MSESDLQLTQSHGSLSSSGPSSVLDASSVPSFIDIDHEGPSTSRRTVAEDGGWFAWLQVFCCSALFFTTLGGIYSWGIMQEALVEQGLAPSSTLAFIGSTQAVIVAIVAIPASRLVGAYGPRRISLVGSVLITLGPVLAGGLSKSVVGIWMTEGLLFGCGQSLCFFSAAVLPSSYFLKNRNFATGLTYAGAGFGGAAFSLITEALLKRFDVAWTFRIQGLIFFAINIPASLALKSRLPRQPLRSSQPIVDWDVRFSLVFFGGAIALFPLFVPPFFLPLYAVSIGLSTSSGSLILAAFNLASAAGRIGFGLGADRILGSVNSLVICLLLVGASTLVIWPLSESLTPLTFFAVVNGFCESFGFMPPNLNSTILILHISPQGAGGFFSLIPGVVSSLFGSSKLPSAFSLLVTSWAPGYFLGAPVAGYLLGAFGGPGAGFKAFQPAIFYSGGMSLMAAGLVVAVRLIESRKVWKRV